MISIYWAADVFNLSDTTWKIFSNYYINEDGFRASIITIALAAILIIVRLLGNVNCVKFVQPLKAPKLIISVLCNVTLFILVELNIPLIYVFILYIIIFSIFVQSLKTPLSNISPLYIVTLFNPEQYWKELLAIDVRLSGNVNSVKPEQYPKALFPIDLILLGNVNCVKPVHL